MKRLMLLLVPATLFAAQARYARLGMFDGSVDVQLHAADDWIAAERNLPLTESAWVRTGPASRAEIELDEGSAWRLGPNSQCEISDYSRLSTGQRITLLSLDRGLAYFSGFPEGKDSLVVAVPGAQVSLSRNARVRLEVQESWSQIAVLQGTVRFWSPAAEIDLREGQTTRVEPANPARFFLNKEVPVLDLDRWSDQRDKTLASVASAAHVIERYGLADLDSSGEWIQTSDQGVVWKPKVPDGWVPFQNGRWRWYDSLGYTWISDDAWGWLPYHYGRWTHRETVGWVWVPAANAIFKPGDAYWLRGAKLAGWGPLAPGEDWKPSNPEGGTPRQFLGAYTTFAEFRSDADVIDPAGFAARPKDPLVTAAFVLALPSPAFLTARLEAVRPARTAGGTRVTTFPESVTYQSSAARPIVVVNPAPPPPVVVITEQPPEPASSPADVSYPVPVYTGLIITPQLPVVQDPSSPAPPSGRLPKQSLRPSSPVNSRVGEQPGEPKHPHPPVHESASSKEFRDAEERRLVSEVIKDVGSNSFSKALTDLENWSQKYHESDYRDDRLYYYIVTYNGLHQASKVVDSATQLLSTDVRVAFQDQRQMILALYLTSVNVQKLPRLSLEQYNTGRTAARNLQDFVAGYFTPGNRPADTSVADWAKARRELESAAETTLTAMASRPVPRH